MPITRRMMIAGAALGSAALTAGAAAAQSQNAGRDEPTDGRDIRVLGTGDGEMLRIGPTRIRVLEDGRTTDNRFGAVASVLPAGVPGPPRHRHLMHDETFLVTEGTLRFVIGDAHRDAGPGAYIVVPIGAPHTFKNVSDAPVAFFSTFTPAFYVNYFRDLAALSARGDLDGPAVLGIMRRYATEPA